MAYFGFTNKIFAGEPIKIFNNGDMLRDFTYVDDIVTGIKNILPCPPSKDENGDQYKVYNIGNNKPEKLLTFIETLEEIIGIEAKKNICPCSRVMFIKHMLMSASLRKILTLNLKRV